MIAAGVMPSTACACAMVCGRADVSLWPKLHRETRNGHIVDVVGNATLLIAANTLDICLLPIEVHGVLGVDGHLVEDRRRQGRKSGPEALELIDLDIGIGQELEG